MCLLFLTPVAAQYSRKKKKKKRKFQPSVSGKPKCVLLFPPSLFPVSPGTLAEVDVVTASPISLSDADDPGGGNSSAFSNFTCLEEEEEEEDLSVVSLTTNGTDTEVTGAAVLWDIPPKEVGGEGRGGEGQNTSCHFANILVELGYCKFCFFPRELLELTHNF